MVGSSSFPLDQVQVHTPYNVQSTSKSIFILGRSMEYNTPPIKPVKEILGVYDNVDALMDAIKNVYAIKWDDVDLRIKSLLNGCREVGITSAIGGSKENPYMLLIRYSIACFDLNVTDPEMVCMI